jgi:hypothetical protein
MRGDEVSLRITQVEQLDKASAKHQRGLKIEIRDETALNPLYDKLHSCFAAEKAKNDEKQVHFLLKTQDNTHAEVKLAGFYRLSPSLVGEIRLTQGVIKVAEM